MGFLLVFFPEDNQPLLDKTKLFPSSSPSSSSSSISSISRKSSSNLLFTKAQFTISICALLVFISLLFFTLSSFDSPTIPSPSLSRRFLSQKPLHTQNHIIHLSHRSSWLSKFWKRKPFSAKRNKISGSVSALQGMGTLYRRGTSAMSDLVVCHLVEGVNSEDFRLFLRLLHRSGLTARSDLVFIFPSRLNSSSFGSIILEENNSFFKLVHHYQQLNNTRRLNGLGFDVTQFVKGGKKENEAAEPLWGKRIKSAFNKSGEWSRLSYGSVVGFETADLDPEDSFGGFLGHVQMSLRRWACYPMLLGRVRRNFKHIILVDVNRMVVLGDPLNRIRSMSPESVYIFNKPGALPSKHGKMNSDKTQSHWRANPGIIMGGARGVRRLSNAMLTEIVRASILHKRKNSVSESDVLSQLSNNEFALKNIDLIKWTESVQEASRFSNRGLVSASGNRIIQRGDSNYEEFNSIIMKQICSCLVDSSVYSDC